MLKTACACAKLRRSARIVSAIYDEALAPIGFSVAQYSLLRMLERTGPSKLSDFAAATGHDRTTLNRTLRPLEEAGLVASGAGKDARSRVMSVTKAGHEVIARGQAHWEEAQARIAQKLGGSQDALFAMLDRLEELRA
jgi:DNA-binding MarR family transcriptional regulator